MNLKEKLLSTGVFLDNEYLDKYVELITNNYYTENQRYKTQKHHIIPRCYYKDNSLVEDNSQKNIITLLYKDHILAHCYIVLSSVNSSFKAKNAYAIYKLIGHRDFKYLKETMSKLDEVQKAYESAKHLLHDANPMFNAESKAAHDAVCKTDSFRKKISDSLKKYRNEHGFSEEHRKRLSEAAKNRVYPEGHGTECASRSIACYCIDSNGDKHEFDSYKAGGIWWYKTYNPFNKYVECTMQRKIKDSIRMGYCKYTTGKTVIVVDNVKWYSYEKSCAETIESI